MSFIKEDFCPEKDEKIISPMSRYDKYNPFKILRQKITVTSWLIKSITMYFPEMQWKNFLSGSVRCEGAYYPEKVENEAFWENWYCWQNEGCWKGGGTIVNGRDWRALALSRGLLELVSRVWAMVMKGSRRRRRRGFAWLKSWTWWWRRRSRRRRWAWTESEESVTGSWCSPPASTTCTMMCPGGREEGLTRKQIQFYKIPFGPFALWRDVLGAKANHVSVNNFNLVLILLYFLFVSLYKVRDLQE